MVSKLRGPGSIEGADAPSVDLGAEAGLDLNRLDLHDLGGNGGELEAIGRRPTVNPVEFSPFPEPPAPAPVGDIALLLDIVLDLTVELGRTRMTVREILNLGPGSVVELDKLAGEAVDISVNDTFIAKGEVVVVDEKFGVRVTEIMSPAKRLASAV